ncbi:RnfABCDGE type electron transport complex subunit D [Mucisphaera sp.]|uniref:RnfABCDGE type electron transport complex subunit D n=1 Tax=Mucisphaera sp. TaxID=2913024 RepID=UPI003D0E4DCF
MSQSLSICGRPWLRPRFDTAGYDRQAMIGMGGLVLMATLAVGPWALILSLTCTAATVAAGYVAAALACNRCWLSVQPRLIYLITLGLATSLILRPEDALLRALATGLITGTVSLWLGRSSPIRIHPAILAALLTWPLLAAPDAPTSQANKQPGNWQTTSIPAWPQPLHETSSNAASPQTSRLATAVTDHWQTVTQDPKQWPQLISHQQLPPLTQVIWNHEPAWLGLVSLPCLLLCGAFLLRGRILSWRVPTYGLLAAGITAAIWPSEGEPWTVLEAFMPVGSLAFSTWISYVLLSTPLLLILLVHAEHGMPISLTGRVIAAAITGSGAIIGLTWTQSPEGALFGILIAGALSRLLDKVRTSPFVQ